MKYWHPVCLCGEPTLFMKPTPQRAQCIYKPIMPTLISMKAKNQVCAKRKVQARKGNNTAKLIATQQKDYLHFKQVEVQVAMHISISQGIFLIQEILVSQMPILCSMILKIPIKSSGLKRGRSILLKKIRILLSVQSIGDLLKELF